MTNQLIGQTIYRQILESRIANEPFMTNFFKVVNATQLVILEDGLQFKAKGDKFWGRIKVTLNDMDTYDIEFLNDFKNEREEVNDIYNDQLLSVLWNRVVIV